MHIIRINLLGELLKYQRKKRKSTFISNENLEPLEEGLIIASDKVVVFEPNCDAFPHLDTGGG